MPHQPHFPEPVSPDRIARFLAGELSGAEADQIRTSIDANPSLRGFVAGVKAGIRGEALGAKPTGAATWAEMRERIGQSEHRSSYDNGQAENVRVRPWNGRPISTSRSVLHAELRSALRSWRGIALASVGVLAVTVIAGGTSVRDFLRNGISAIKDNNGGAMVRTYATRDRERAEVALPDGTRATLASRTTLRVSSAFGRGTRTVVLSGEAYFQVTTAHSAPFIVHTSGVSTQVLGTTFGVRRYTTDPTITVTVVSGKVAVRDATGTTIVASGNTASANDSVIVVTASSDAHGYTDWAHGRLVFKDAPISEVLATVGRWHGYHFRVSEPSLASGRVSGVFEMRNTEETMTVLKDLLDVSMTFDGDVVILSPRTRAPETRKSRRETFSQQMEVGR